MNAGDNPIQPEFDYDNAVTKRSVLIKVAVIVGVIYAVICLLECARQSWWSTPKLAADEFIEALQKNDPTGIYMLSDMLNAHLTGMMVKSNVSTDTQKHMLAKDFNQWKDEFNEGSRAHDTLSRERKLVNSNMEYSSISCSDFKAEVQTGETRSLESYNDVPGQTYHICYRFTYPSARLAPTVSLLDNIRTARKRRIKSVAVRVEVSRRPDVTAPRSWILSWKWLDTIAPAFPLRYLFSNSRPEEIWMARISFQIDKTKIDTY